ncbi:MAG: winged helix-turn-helix domain-containing protein [Proteobacteria bacterium]|nr:winged helix-turn-helix domain-containing protein [Pseudomonadota bacterium]
MSELENPVYRFKGFELEPAERRLSQAGKSVALTPKVFDTLVLLVERAGHVVSKDELMKALWPRGYVDESNLTKHIWFIRRALGDTDHDSRFIETVPKIGYRFIASVIRELATPPPPVPAPALPLQASETPVQVPSAVVAGRADAELQAAPAPAALPVTPPGRAGHLGWGAAAVAVVLVASGLLGVWLKKPASPVLAGSRAGRTVAFVGFSNLSRNAKDAWLAPALSEMLGAELNAADNVEVIPDELVRDAGLDLPPPAAGGYSAQSLAKLRRALDADYVVSGSYLVTGATNDAALRVDVAVQDTRGGTPLFLVSEDAVISGLIALVKHEGATLRGKLGARALDADTLSLVGNAQPPSGDVARRLGFALDALQHYDAARARDELLEAIAEAPAYAPAYTYLAQAWSSLGYRDKALAAAEQAAQHSANLPLELRLQAEAEVDAQHAEWAKAAVAWQSLTRMKPLDVGYRLRGIDAQVAAGAADAARAALQELQRLPGAGADPRVQLAAARIAGSQDDAKSAERYAVAAVELARRRNASGLIADAELALGGARTHLNKNEEALADLGAAIAAYRAVQNPRGEAAARTDLAQALGNLNRNQESREEFERAMALDQSIGDLAGVAGVYRNLCGMLWLHGDRDGAQAAARHALELGRETGDLELQAWTLQALATIACDEAASDEVLSEYREVVALEERRGHQIAWSLTNVADVQRLRGELDAARATCARAYALAAPLSDAQFAIFSGFTCALIEVDRGNAGAARAGFEEVIRRVGTGGDMSYRHNAVMMLAQLDIDAGRWSVARERLQEASRGFAAAEERTGEADADALLALCEQALGHTAERDAALQAARTLRRSITSRQEVYAVDIVVARLGEPEHPDADAAVERLLTLAQDAEHRHFVAWSLESQLAAWEVLRTHDGAAAQALRVQIEKSARAYGFGRILRLLQSTEPSRSARG